MSATNLIDNFITYLGVSYIRDLTVRQNVMWSNLEQDK